MLDLSKENRPLTQAEIKKLVSACGGNAESRKRIRKAYELPGDAFGESMYPLTLTEGTKLGDFVNEVKFRNPRIEPAHLDTLVSSEMCGDWQVSSLTPFMQRKTFMNGIKSLDEPAAYCRSKGWELATPIQMVAFIAHYKIPGKFLVPVTETVSGITTILHGSYSLDEDWRDFMQIPLEYMKNWFMPPECDILCVRRP